jgi:hypothetical protein
MSSAIVVVYATSFVPNGKQKPTILVLISKYLLDSLEYFNLYLLQPKVRTYGYQAIHV